MTIKRNIIIAAAAIGFFLILFSYTSNHIIIQIVIGTFGSILASLIISIPVYMFQFSNNVDLYKTLLLSLVPIIRRNKIRVSCSYQFSIKLGSEYLLINDYDGKKIQLIGGAYKFYQQATSSLRRFKAVDAFEKHTKPGDNDYENDIRLAIPLKSFPDFYKWFQSGHEREYNVLRELYEELFSEQDSFPKEMLFELKISKLATITKFKEYDKKNNYYRFYSHDVFSIQIVKESILYDYFMKAYECQKEHFSLLAYEDIQKEPRTSDLAKEMSFA